jgi:hypothetical protein
MFDLHHVCLTLAFSLCLALACASAAAIYLLRVLSRLPSDHDHTPFDHW